MFIPKQQQPQYATPETVADGEYTAKISGIRFTKTGDSLMFICSLTTPGFEGINVVGFCKASWAKPTGRTTANLYMWVKNLGGQLIDGQEDLFEMDTLNGKDCRVIVQSYIQKSTGEARVKVVNVLPFTRSVPNPMQQRQGYSAAPVQQHVQAPAATAQQFTANNQNAQQQYPNNGFAQNTVSHTTVQEQRPAQQQVPQQSVNTGSENGNNSLW